jgi:hypothetical protein
MSKYFKLKERLTGKIKNPKLIDCIELEYKGVKVDVYGILHGVTGGTNQNYIDNVNKTIEAARGTKFCEKSMKSLYKGLDEDVHDWRQMNCKDAFIMSFKSFMDIRFPWILLRTMFREKFNKNSNFGKNNIFAASQISGSMAFHLLKPSERRLLAGFPLPEQYMKLNLLRREGKDNRKINFVDPDWKWLTYIEPRANIPMRSIHMIEYTVEYCIKNNINQASLFVGEIHNSDIEWYVNCQNEGSLPKFLESQSEIVHSEAMDVVNDNYKWKQIKYLLSLGSGSLLSMSIYTLLAVFLSINI